VTVLAVMTAAAPLPQAPWGTLLAVYFTMVGLPSGLTLATLWHRDRFPATSTTLDRRAGWTSLTLLGVAGVLLIADLGRPERFFLMLSRFGNWDSPISLGAKIIAVKVFLLAVALYLMRRRRVTAPGSAGLVPAHPTARFVRRGTSWLLGAASVALAVYPVAVLARTWVSPLAATSGSALLYLLTALIMGSGAVQLLQVWDRDVAEGQRIAHRDATMALLVAYVAVLILAAVSVPNGPARQAVSSLLTGTWAPAFYSGVLVIGVLVPTGLLLLAPHSRTGRIAAAAAVLVGAGTLRYLIFAA
jgi:formate-dependent nitrite reductase membrane component NrfD